MAADITVAGELAALQEELSAPSAKRPAPAPRADPDRPQATSKTEPPSGSAAAEAQQHEGYAAEQLGDLVELVKEFIAEAEHNVAQHPVAGVIGALFLGILIGRLIGRR